MNPRTSLWLFMVLALMAFCILPGCSSLPRKSVRDTQTGKRTYTLQETGSKHMQAGQFDKACVFFERALALHASVDDEPGVVKTLTSLGRCRLAMGRLDQAEADFQKAFLSVRGLPHPQLMAQVMAGLGEVALHRQDPESARTRFEEGLDLDLADPGLERAVLLHDLGAALLALGDHSSAAAHFQQALAQNTALKNPLGTATNCYSLALLHDEMGDRDQARQLAQRALHYDKKAENPPGIGQDLTLLGALAFAEGDPEAGADYYRRAKLVWRALGRADKTAEINEILKAPKSF